MASGQGRKERPINPDDGPVESFASRLRELRKKCGSPTYKEMQRHAPYSSSALSGAAGGQAPPSLAITLAYVRACLEYAKTGSDQVAAAIEEWTVLRQELEAELKPPPGADSALDEEPASAPPSASSAPRGLKVPGRRGRQGLAVTGLLVLLGLAVWTGKNLARPGSAEAGSAFPERSSGSSSSTQARDEQAGQVQVDPLGPQSRCSPARSGSADVSLRACVRVEDERVLFALKVTNLGPKPVEVTARLSYVRAGQYHSCRKADGLWHGTVPAHDSHVTEPADCAVDRTQAAYQADGLLALGDTQNWVAHQLSPNAHAYPHDVRWRCRGDVPC
ncbi:hypothetical protein [Streptomyces sp. NPDC007205]|uniref:hypothetical protein n=1 Tax=Streptomyces sp. NPDC007205 TaxID=3154316 RepID=UPI0033C5E3DB